MSSKLSGTYNSVLQAKKLLILPKQKRIFIIDSLNISAGEGLLILRALDLIKEEEKIEKIISVLQNFIICAWRPLK